MKNVNIYFDEKGPTKTLRISPSKEAQFNFFDGSDDIPSYFGVYLAIPKDKQDEFDDGFQEIINVYKSKTHKFTNSKELKANNIIHEKLPVISDINKVTADLYIALFQLIDNTGSKFQLSSFDKTEVFIAKRLKEWFYFLDRNTTKFKVNSFAVIYTITKFLRTEDKYLQSKFTEVFESSSKSTFELLEILKKQLLAANKKYAHSPRAKKQILEYKQLIKIINSTSRIFRKEYINITEYSFPTDHLAYGLDLFILEQQENFDDIDNIKDSITIFLDEGAPSDGLKSNGFYNVKEDLDSKDYLGLQASDLLAGLFGKFMATMDDKTYYDPEDPNTIRLNTKIFEKNLNEYSNHYQLAQEMYYHAFGEKSYHYSFVHSNFSDYVFIFQGYLEAVLTPGFSNLNISEKVEEHLRKTKKHMEDLFEQMDKQYGDVHNSPYKNIQTAIEAGVLKPF